MNNIWGLFNIIRIGQIPNVHFIELCVEDEMINETGCWWLGHIEILENTVVGKKLYEGICMGSHIMV